MNPLTPVLSAAFVLAGLAVGAWISPFLAPPLFVVGILVLLSVRVANVWEKFVILRLGKLQSVKGAGFFMIIPIIDRIAAVIDERIQTTAFNAEQALTKDTVPVNVDAVIFWHVHDAEKAALAITDYRQAIDRVAQTSLREMIGASMLPRCCRTARSPTRICATRSAEKPSIGGSPCARSRPATSRSPSRCRIRCRARRRPSAKSRRA